MGQEQNKPTPCLDLGEEQRVIPTPGVPYRISWDHHSSTPRSAQSYLSHRLQTSFPRAVLGKSSACRSLGLRSVPSGTRCKTSMHYMLYFGDSPVKEVSDLKWFTVFVKTEFLKALQRLEKLLNLWNTWTKEGGGREGKKTFEHTV